MSMFCNKSRTAKLDQQEAAIIQCKITRDNIKAYIKRLEKNEKQRKDKAKEALRSSNKDRARMYLQQAKMYREQINSGTGQLNMIEEQIVQIESAKQMKEAYKVLENGNNVLKKLNEEVNIEKWERIADDLSDLKQQQDEIGNFFKSHGIEQSEFEEEVDKELDDLFKSVSQQEIESLPEAGTKEIQQKKEASDKHAALLEA